MDLPCLFIGAMIAGVVEVVLKDLSQRPQLKRVHAWLAGEDARPHLECALARAVAETAEIDAVGVLDWRYLLPPQAIAALARSVGGWRKPAAAPSADLLNVWLTLAGNGPQTRKALTPLSAALISKFQNQLAADPPLQAILNAGTDEDASTAITAWPAIAGSPDQQRLGASLSLRRVAAPFWEALAVPNAADALAWNVPFVACARLDEGRNAAKNAIRVYPGEQALILVDGRAAPLPRGPGPLVAQQLRQELKIRGGKQALEAVIYGADQLILQFADLQTRDADDQQVLVTCELRFQVSNITRFHAEYVKRSQVYTLARLRAALERSAQAAAEHYMKRKRFSEVDASLEAVGELGVFLEQEFNRPEHRLTDAGLTYLGLLNWQPENPAVTARRRVRDGLEPRIAALEAEKLGLTRLLDEWRAVQKLRKEAGADELPPDEVDPPRPRRVAWVYPAGAPDGPLAEVRARPAIVGERVYLADRDGKVACLNCDTGRPRPGWKPPRVGEVLADLAYADGSAHPPVLLVPCEDGKLRLLDPETGAEAGCLDTGGRLRAAPLLSQGWVYLACAAGARWGGVVAYGLGDGSETGRWQGRDKRGVKGAPALDEARHSLYFATMAENGDTVYRADVRRSGDAELIYRTDGPVEGGVVLDTAQQCLYVATAAGALHAVRLDGGTGWNCRLTGGVRVSPALVGGALYVATDAGYLYAFDAAGGEMLWPPFQARGAILTTPVARGDQILFGAQDGRAHAVYTGSGQEYAAYAAGHPVRALVLAPERDLLIIGCAGASGGLLRALPADLAHAT